TLSRLVTPVPHICRNLLPSKNLWQTGFSRSDAQIGTDISIAATGCVEKFARDVRKVRCNNPDVALFIVLQVNRRLVNMDKVPLEYGILDLVVKSSIAPSNPGLKLVEFIASHIQGEDVGQRGSHLPHALFALNVLIHTPTGETRLI